MSAHDLIASLADPARAGVRLIDARDAELLVEPAAALGLALVRIDLSGCTDKDAALDRIARALQFPEWFGRNWDALADSLRDLSWAPAPGYVLLFEHGEAWRDRGDPEVATLLDILDEAARSWAARDVPFWPVLALTPP